jgi:hypothetical protein
MSRYPLGLGVRFRWMPEEGGESSGAGVVRDISAIGLFVLSADCPPRGALVTCGVTVPDSSDVGDLQIKASGRVVRVVVGGEKQGGFAVCGDMQLFCDGALRL